MQHAMMKVCENVSTVEKMKSAFDSMVSFSAFAPTVNVGVTRREG